MRKLSFGLAVAAAIAFSRVARADEVADLEKSLNAQHDALATSDCTLACQALGSIRRAADRICAIEPGPRCVAAQAKAFEDTRKVRDACPQCVIATTATSPTSSVTPAPEPPPEPQVTRSSAEVSVQSAPAKGGCASCETGGASPPDLGVAALGTLALARLLRARARRRRGPG